MKIDAGLVMGMRNAVVEPWVHQYAITLHLLKALEVDRKNTQAMKLSRIWNGFFERLSILVEREHVSVKQQLRRNGCRIVLEEVTPEKNFHMMYVFRGYEYHCTIMPVVLKGKCEEKLKELLGADDVSTTT